MTDDRTGEEDATSLTRVGHLLGGAAHQITSALTARLRVDPETRDHARAHTRSELENHTATLLTDMAQMLVVLEEDGADAAAIVGDGHELQELLSERHGTQRCRIGFTERSLVREFEILEEEVESALRHARIPGAGEAVSESLVAIRRLLARARRRSIDAFRRAREPA